MDRNGAFSGSIVFCMDGVPPILLTDKIRLPNNDAAAPTDVYVLILSREEDTSFLPATMLELRGFRAEVWHDLEHSLSINKQHPPALILLDSIFPFAANLEAIRRIRADESLEPNAACPDFGFFDTEMPQSLARGRRGRFFPQTD